MKNRINVSYCLFVLLLSMVLNVMGQTNNAEQQESYKSEVLPGAEVDRDYLKKEAEKLNFSESEPPKETPQEVPEKIPKVHSVKKKAPVALPVNLIYWFAFAVLAAGLVWLLFRLKSARTETDEADLGIHTEHGIDADRLKKLKIDQELELALQAKDIRMAVRVLFLKNLKLLMEKGWIYPALEKTNMEYVAELNGRPQQQDLLEVTRIFEWVWYGEADLSTEQFLGIKVAFDKVYQSIHQYR